MTVPSLSRRPCLGRRGRTCPRSPIAEAIDPMPVGPNPPLRQATTRRPIWSASKPERLDQRAQPAAVSGAQAPAALPDARTLADHAGPAPALGRPGAPGWVLVLRAALPAFCDRAGAPHRRRRARTDVG